MKLLCWLFGHTWTRWVFKIDVIGTGHFAYRERQCTRCGREEVVL